MKYFLSILFLTFSFWLSAQEYVEIASKDDVSISYKWKKKRLLDRESPYVLCLQIKNKGIVRKIVNFELLYYWDGMLHSRSGLKEYCVKPGKTLWGRRWDLVYQSDIKTLEQIHNRRFRWEIDDLVTENNGWCKSGLRLSLEPAHQMRPIKDKRE